MELLTLDSKFQPTAVVENYQSLIWTERYDKAGDFQLVSNDVFGTITALPRESYITLRETTVPMVVESHKIEKKKNEAPIVTVTGRSFEACALERRASVRDAPPSARSAWTLAAAKESDAAYLAMRTVLGDTSRYQSNVLVLNAINAAVDAVNDPIPEIDLVLPQDYVTSTANNYDIKPDTLYNTVMGLLVINNHGIKSTRPAWNGTKVGVEIYNGADLTNTVVFDARFDQIDSATYLLSAQGSANVAYVYGTGGSNKVLKTAAAEPSGMSRRILVLDGTSDTSYSTSAGRQSRGLVELYKNNVTALFDGEVAQQVAAGYNKTYFLGDILKLNGEYGLSQNVRVKEFIRSSDAQGEKAYPTLEAVTS